jgi:hypothetical protein
MEDYADYEGGCGCEGGAAFRPEIDPEVTGGGFVSSMSSMGRAYTAIGAVIACLIALVLIVIGVFEIARARDTEATATVTKIVSSPPAGGTAAVTHVVDATFTDAAGAAVALTNLSVVSADPKFGKGSTFEVYYNPSDPSGALAESVSSKTLGAGLVVGGVVLAGLGVGVAVLARKSTAFAAVEGVAGTANILSRVF